MKIINKSKKTKTYKKLCRQMLLKRLIIHSLKGKFVDKKPKFRNWIKRKIKQETFKLAKMDNSKRSVEDLIKGLVHRYKIKKQEKKFYVMEYNLIKLAMKSKLYDFGTATNQPITKNNLLSTLADFNRFYDEILESEVFKKEKSGELDFESLLSLLNIYLDKMIKEYKGWTRQDRFSLRQIIEQAKKAFFAYKLSKKFVSSKQSYLKVNIFERLNTLETFSIKKLFILIKGFIIRAIKTSESVPSTRESDDFRGRIEYELKSPQKLNLDEEIILGHERLHCLVDSFGNLVRERFHIDVNDLVFERVKSFRETQREEFDKKTKNDSKFLAKKKKMLERLKITKEFSKKFSMQFGAFVQRKGGFQSLKKSDIRLMKQKFRYDNINQTLEKIVTRVLFDLVDFKQAAKIFAEEYPKKRVYNIQLDRIEATFKTLHTNQITATAELSPLKEGSSVKHDSLRSRKMIESSVQSVKSKFSGSGKGSNNLQGQQSRQKNPPKSWFNFNQAQIESQGKPDDQHYVKRGDSKGKDRLSKGGSDALSNIKETSIDFINSQSYNTYKSSTDGSSPMTKMRLMRAPESFPAIKVGGQTAESFAFANHTKKSRFLPKGVDGRQIKLIDTARSVRGDTDADNGKDDAEKIERKGSLERGAGDLLKQCKIVNLKFSGKSCFLKRRRKNDLILYKGGSKHRKRGSGTHREYLRMKKGLQKVKNRKNGLKFKFSTADSKTKRTDSSPFRESKKRSGGVLRAQGNQDSRRLSVYSNQNSDLSILEKSLNEENILQASFSKDPMQQRLCATDRTNWNYKSGQDVDKNMNKFKDNHLKTEESRDSVNHSGRSKTDKIKLKRIKKSMMIPKLNLQGLKQQDSIKKIKLRKSGSQSMRNRARLQEGSPQLPGVQTESKLIQPVTSKGGSRFKFQVVAGGNSKYSKTKTPSSFASNFPATKKLQKSTREVKTYRGKRESVEKYRHQSSTRVETMDPKFSQKSSSKRKKITRQHSISTERLGIGRRVSKGLNWGGQLKSVRKHERRSKEVEDFSKETVIVGKPKGATQKNQDFSYTVFENFRKYNHILITKAKIALLEVLSPECLEKLALMDKSCLKELQKKVTNRISSFILNQVYVGGDLLEYVDDHKIGSTEDRRRMPDRVFFNHDVRFNLKDLSVDLRKLE